MSTTLLEDESHLRLLYLSLPYAHYNQLCVLYTNQLANCLKVLGKRYDMPKITLNASERLQVSRGFWIWTDLETPSFSILPPVEIFETCYFDRKK